MLAQLTKTTAFLVLGFWLKPRYRGLLFATLLIALDWMVYADYLDYTVHTAQQEPVLLALVVKWAFIVLVLLGYWLLVERRLGRATATGEDEIKLPDTLKPAGATPVNDGFDKLRQKRTLKSKTQQLLDD